MPTVTCFYCVTPVSRTGASVRVLEFETSVAHPQVGHKQVLQTMNDSQLERDCTAGTTTTHKPATAMPSSKSIANHAC